MHIPITKYVWGEQKEREGGGGEMRQLAAKSTMRRIWSTFDIFCTWYCLSLTNIVLGPRFKQKRMMKLP